MKIYSLSESIQYGWECHGLCDWILGSRLWTESPNHFHQSTLHRFEVSGEPHTV